MQSIKNAICKATRQSAIFAEMALGMISMDSQDIAIYCGAENRREVGGIRRYKPSIVVIYIDEIGAKASGKKQN